MQYHNELTTLATSLNLHPSTAKTLATALSTPSHTNVLFLLSVPSSLKSTLLNAASLLVYTPGLEHFGIVPLEAMLARLPVLAADSGGPTETVVDGRTGWLRSVDAVGEWTDVMRMVLQEMSARELEGMGEQGRKRVVEQFSKRKMAERLDVEIEGMVRMRRRPSVFGEFGAVLLFAAVGLLSAALWTVWAVFVR